MKKEQIDLVNTKGKDAIENLIEGNKLSFFLFLFVIIFISVTVIESTMMGRILTSFFLIMFQEILFIGYLIKINAYIAEKHRSIRDFSPFSVSWIKLAKEEEYFKQLFIVLLIKTLIVTVFSFSMTSYIISGFILHIVVGNMYYNIIYKDEGLNDAVINGWNKFNKDIELYLSFIKKSIILLIIFTVLIYLMDRGIGFGVFGFLYIAILLALLSLAIEDLMFSLALPVFAANIEKEVL